MSDIFNLSSIDDGIFTVITKLSSLHVLCKDLVKEMDEKQGEEIAKVIENIDTEFNSVKENVVKMLYILNDKE